MSFTESHYENAALQPFQTSLSQISIDISMQM